LKPDTAFLDTCQTLEAKTFREAMSRIATAVHIVTTDGPGGMHGMTVSSFCSVSDAPPSVLVCLNRMSRVHDAVLQNRCFCVNTLRPGHETISDIFGGRGDVPMAERFTHGDWISMGTGSPALVSSSLSADCEITSVTEVGSHSVIVGSVLDLRIADHGEALVYVKRDYQALP